MYSTISGTHNLSRNSYVFNFGDGLWDSRYSDAENRDKKRNEKCMSDCREAFTMGGRVAHRNFGYMVDGLSNTLAVSEAVVSKDRTNSRNIKGAVARVENIWNSNVTNPTNCMTVARNPGNSKEFAESLTITSWRGYVFSDGRIMATGFTTVTPPNSPCCAQNNNGDNTWGIFPPSSHHTGGVNAAWFDGSVSFIPETIDTNGSSQNSVLTGASPYGMFGAIGTPNGGEAQRL